MSVKTGVANMNIDVNNMLTYFPSLQSTDLEEDLNGLRKWLHEVESQLLPLCMRNNWTTPELETKLKDHQVRLLPLLLVEKCYV